VLESLVVLQGMPPASPDQREELQAPRP
jgi:hypothetical protein